jgi:hypothetical protein
MFSFIKITFGFESKSVMVLPDGRFSSDGISEKIKISDSEATNQNVQMLFSLLSILLSYCHPFP